MKKEKETKVVEQTQYPHEALKRVEDTRLVFWKSYKMHNTFKLLVMMVCLAAIIVTFIVLPNVIGNSSVQLGLTIGIAVLALGGTYGYSLFVRKKFERKMKEYFELYFNCCNEYVYGEKPFSGAELQNPGKITPTLWTWRQQGGGIGNR